MSDADLRSLEAASKADPTDAWKMYRYRLALVRAGRSPEAGFQVGDVVGDSVDSGPWVVRQEWTLGGSDVAYVEGPGGKRACFDVRCCRKGFHLLEPAMPTEVETHG